jgi:adenosylmethionine-8-amino-7-oxononanoate aminotransferase
VLVLAPPYIVSTAQIDQLVQGLKDAITRHAANP